MRQGLPNKKVSTLAEFYGLFLFWRRFALDNSKIGKCPLCLVLIGSLVDKTQQSLRLVFRFVIRFHITGQFQPNIIGQKGICPFYFGGVHTDSPQIDEKTTQVCGELVNDLGKNLR